MSSSHPSAILLWDAGTCRQRKQDCDYFHIFLMWIFHGKIYFYRAMEGTHPDEIYECHVVFISLTMNLYTWIFFYW
jgi:hypothetical protein